MSNNPFAALLNALSPAELPILYYITEDRHLTKGQGFRFMIPGSTDECVIVHPDDLLEVAANALGSMYMKHIRERVPEPSFEITLPDDLRDDMVTSFTLTNEMFEE